MLNLDQLSAFVAAAETGSFSAAGRQLGKSQSTISVSVNNLEVDLGVQLFDRSSKYPTLTEEGERLYQQSKLLMRQAERIEHYTAGLRQDVESTLTLGLDPLLPITSIESDLEKLAQKFPFTQLKIVKLPSEEIITALTDKTIDVGLHLATKAVPEHLEFATITNLEWVCVCSPDGDFADMEVVSNDALLAERQIVCESLLLHPVLGATSIMSQSYWLAQDQDDVVRLVEQGVGWAFLPKLLLEERAVLGSMNQFKPEFQKTNMQSAVDCLWEASAHRGPAQTYLTDLLCS